MGRRGDPNFGCFRWKYQNMSFDLKFICHSLTIKPCEVHSSIIQAISYITLKSILGKLRGVETLNVFIETPGNIILQLNYSSNLIHQVAKHFGAKEMDWNSTDSQPYWHGSLLIQFQHHSIECFPVPGYLQALC